jgi:hypothetical protein
MMEDVANREVRVLSSPNPIVPGHNAPGFRGTLERLWTDARGRELADVRERDSHGLYTVLADRIHYPGQKRLKPIAYAEDFDGKKERRRTAIANVRGRPDEAPALMGGAAEVAAGRPRAARVKRERGTGARDCSCACGGATAGGNFLPGHDAKLVAMVRRGEKDKSVLAPFPRLLAKL